MCGRSRTPAKEIARNTLVHLTFFHLGLERVRSFDRSRRVRVHFERDGRMGVRTQAKETQVISAS